MGNPGSFDFRRINNKYVFNGVDMEDFELCPHCFGEDYEDEICPVCDGDGGWWIHEEDE